QRADLVERRVGQEIKLHHVSQHGIHNDGVRLRAIEFIDDDVANKVPQRTEPPVASVRRGKADAAQVRRVKRIENAVVGVRGEESAGDIQSTGVLGQAG